MSGRFIAIIVLAVVLAASPAVADVPRVVTSIKPLQSLAAGVMAGIAEPDVLIKGAASVHAYALRPSEAEILKNADIVFWVGPVFETFLVKPLAALSGEARTVALLNAPGLHVLQARNGGLWQDDEDRNSASQDGHIWLNADNAKAIVAAVAETLSVADAPNAARYRANATAMYAKLDALDAELKVKLTPVTAKPFVVFHDAYQYFETSYGLNSVGSITVSAERMPGARRVLALKQRIDALAGAGSVCVFTEPQFEPKLARMLAGETHARTGVLDPEGSALAIGPELHFNLMRDLADNLVRCLTPS